MKNFERPGTWKRYILPTLLLAAVCIGAVELLVCYYQAPETYAAITAPVRASFRWKVPLSIRGITLSYICQKAEMERKARPTRTVVFLFSFMVVKPLLS